MYGDLLGGLFFVAMGIWCFAGRRYMAKGTTDGLRRWGFKVPMWAYEWPLAVWGVIAVVCGVAFIAVALVTLIGG